MRWILISPRSWRVTASCPDAFNLPKALVEKMEITVCCFHGIRSCPQQGVETANCKDFDFCLQSPSDALEQEMSHDQNYDFLRCRILRDEERG